MSALDTLAAAFGNANVTFTVWAGDRQPGTNHSVLDPSYSDATGTSTITGVIDEDAEKAYDINGNLVAQRTATLMCNEVDGGLLSDGMFLRDNASEFGVNVWRVTGKPIHYRAVIPHVEALLVWQIQPPSEVA